MDLSVFEMDKSTEVYSMKIPEVLKVRLDRLSRTQKVGLNNSILYEMVKAVHMSNLEPELYLKSSD